MRRGASGRRRNCKGQAGPGEACGGSPRGGGAVRRSPIRRRAQDGHSAVRRHQGIDRAGARPRSRGGARDHRPCTKADDRRGAPLRRLRGAIDRRRHLRAVRRSGGTRRSSAARTVCRVAHAGRAAKIRLATARTGSRSDHGAGRCAHGRSCGAIDRYRRGTRRVHTDRTQHESRVTPADACGAGLDRD